MEQAKQKENQLGQHQGSQEQGTLAANSEIEVINLSATDSIIGQYLAEIRDVEYQKNRLLFRNNIRRLGEYEAFEVSKRLSYERRR